MVQLTATQIINLTGFIAMKMTTIQYMVRIATDNTLTDDERQAARDKAKDAFQDVAKLVRTAIVRNGYTLQTTEYTDSELATKGIN